MQDLIVSLVQTNQLWEDKTGNLNQFESLLGQIEQTDLIILPEMFHTGFTMNTDLAESMDESSALKWLIKQAKIKNAAIYTSLIIKENERIYNRGVFVEPNGTISHYDKRKTFSLANEDKYYTSGEKQVIIPYAGWNIQLQICYDLRFPELSRNSILGDKPIYDLCIYVANWPARRAEHWKALLKARAIENQSYVIGVNRIGTDANQLEYSGDSSINTLLGETWSCRESEEHVLTQPISLTELTEWREKLPFLKDK
jgi:omega-amidase